jgi:release factor glutamine methyltransferase
MPLVDSMIRDIGNKLRAVYDDRMLVKQYAWWILQALTKKKKAELIELRQIELVSEQERLLQEWLEKIIEQHCPLQYILGSVPFCDVDILVEPPVLIPRPETEEWTTNLIDKLKKLPVQDFSILDLCTGSGCIAIALARAFPKAWIVAVDIQDHALQLTSVNCIHNSIRNVTIIKSDLFESVPKDYTFDLIVSNPPYIALDEWKELDQSVKNWEDKKALVAPNQGMDIIASIIQQAPQFLRQRSELEIADIPQLILEIGYRQGGKVKTLLEQAGYCHIRIDKDLQGKDRVACARVMPCGYLNKD